MSGKLKQQDIPPAEDLSDLGAPPAPPRGSGLSELLGAATPTARRQPVPEARAEAVEAVREDDSVAPARPTRITRQSSTRSRTRPTSAVYVSQGVKQRFEDYRHKAKKTNLQVVLDAITAKHEDLHDIIKKSAVSTAPVGSLFPPADPSAVRYLGGGGACRSGSVPRPNRKACSTALGRILASPHGVHGLPPQS